MHVQVGVLSKVHNMTRNMAQNKTLSDKLPLLKLVSGMFKMSLQNWCQNIKLSNDSFCRHRPLDDAKLEFTVVWQLIFKLSMVYIRCVNS